MVNNISKIFFKIYCLQKSRHKILIHQIQFNYRIDGSQIDMKSEKTPTKTSAKKAVTPKAKKPTKSKRKTNLLKLCSEMNKLVADAVDREIVRRFKIIVETGDDDITKSSLTAILKEPFTIIPSSYEERLQPYIKHYIFMLKRRNNNKNNKELK